MRLAIAFASLVLSACYDPTLRDCAVTCRTAGDCGGGQVCGADGWCAAPAMAGRCDAARDATVSEAVDAASEPDGPGAHVIECFGAGACDQEIRCPAGLPCVVRCHGDGACAKRIRCEEATSCVVECTGEDTCADEVRCGRGPCQVTCTGAGSCAKKTKCGVSCACDVDCGGPDACHDGSECPAGCGAGAGCSSSQDGCDSC